MKKLLVCMPYHHTDGSRMVYLKQVIENLLTYEMDVHIIVDTNVPISAWFDKVDFYVHENMEHSFHLTWKHRKHMADKIDEYDYYMYTEEDMFLPWECFKNYIDTFDIVWPRYVPGLVRIETGPDGKLYNTDATKQQVYNIGWCGTYPEHGSFTVLDFPYHAQWIMPREALKESMSPSFVRLDTNRELAASYPMWELGKTALVRMTEGNKISPFCYTAHLPCNYAMSPDSPFGKIEIDKLLI